MSGAEGLGPVLVTGAARRIGLALAKGFAEIGRPVILHASPRSLREATAAAGARRARGARAETVAADLSDALEARGLIERAESVFGPLTLLVNNASVFEPDGAEDFSLEVYERQMAINLRAPLLLAQGFAARLPPGAEGAGVPLGRPADLSEVVDAVMYLARARTVTGQMIAVDSGQHLAWRTPDVQPE